MRNFTYVLKMMMNYWVGPEIELSEANTRISQYQYISTSIGIISLALFSCIFIAIRMSQSISSPIQTLLKAGQRYQRG